MDVKPPHREEVDGEKQEDPAYANRLVAVKAADRVHVRGAALDELAGPGLGVVAKVSCWM